LHKLQFIPYLISEYRAGRFPIEKLVKTYPATEFQTAIHDIESGKVIKPVLVWK
jgi:Zn-dependent alcohol dehydrogenase